VKPIGVKGKERFSIAVFSTIAICLFLGILIQLLPDHKLAENKATPVAQAPSWDGNPDHPDCSESGHADPKHPGSIISDMYTEACTADHHPTGKPVESANYRQPYRTTASNLYLKFHANEVKAEQELAGNAIVVTGTVAGIRRDFKGDVVVSFYSPNEFLRVGAHLYSGQDEDAANLVTGQKLSVNCERAEMVLGSPQLMECLLLTNADGR
jgi:hypothetical protein